MSINIAVSGTVREYNHSGSLGDQILDDVSVFKSCQIK